jgi:hypothetical protein
MKPLGRYVSSLYGLAPSVPNMTRVPVLENGFVARAELILARSLYHTCGAVPREEHATDVLSHA